jgi:hypothetical protein
VGKQQDEELLRITAHYVAEVEAGRRPLLSDYVARHPQYAAAIADFVTYFHAIEAGIAQESNVPEPLSPLSRRALDHLEASIAQTEPEERATQVITSLLPGRGKRRRSAAQLAQATGLSEDIIVQLEQRTIHPRTIPYEVPRRLARALRKSRVAVQTYLASSPALEKQFADRSQHRRVAEESAAYGVEAHEGNDPEAMSPKSFRRVLEESSQLSPEQKATWYAMLDQEGL